MVNRNAAVRVFKVLRGSPRVRESIYINPKVWGRLSDKIQAEIKAIREELKSADGRKTPEPKPIPLQYGLN